MSPQEPPPDESASKEGDDLSPEEYQQAAEAREIVLTLMPEFLPVLIAAGKLGWIEGWRNVRAWKRSLEEE